MGHFMDKGVEYMPEEKQLAKDLFLTRHIGPSVKELQLMLETLGFSTLDAFMSQVLPNEINHHPQFQLPKECSELQALSELRQLASQNKLATNYIGLGYHPTTTPAVIQRHVLENPAWYTAYTPYQPEVSQGRLEALLNFQQMVMDLTAMPLANASLLDEATAAAEAMALVYRVQKQKKNGRFLIATDVHPQTQDVVLERARFLNIKAQVCDPTQADLSDVTGILLQYPSSSGAVEDYQNCVERLHHQGGLCCVASDLLALTVLKPPGEWGGDVVVGSSQRFGVPMGYGGPHAAFFATRLEFQRSVPGRIIGVSVDVNNQRALRMALQTREQHIRREKANSNICTAQALLANMAAFFAIYHGPWGLLDIAKRIHELAYTLATGLQEKGYELLHTSWFDTISVRCAEHREQVLMQAERACINLRCDQEQWLGITLSEQTTTEDVGQLLSLFPKRSHRSHQVLQGILPTLIRQSPFLQQAVFNSYHNETAMMRYLHRLARRDLSLEYGMIPLGSCTMKLNAASQMMPLSWQEFSQIHPFAPQAQTIGYRTVLTQLKQWLCAMTGFDQVCLQPNSGAQGEYAGLLCIRKYLQSLGCSQRRICFIPSSAHGTNPASAKMAGFDVQVIRCDKSGNIHLQDLTDKLAQFADEVACMMLTYPSTHGVYEPNIRRVCQMMHDAGAQVYMDGANLNAQLGLMQPAFLGADVAHMNLHKTFAIPHGGGGPGMGPIGLKKHLVPFMPGHYMDMHKNPAIAAAPFGSASILTISWMYIRMLGLSGLKYVTQVAVTSANYIAQQLAPYYPILYTGESGFVAHECILDIRTIKAQTTVSELDIAKRLIDYGFHAPTISFPVMGTLMIEPTESEDKTEMDRFIQAMIQIRQEIDRIARGEWPTDNNPLVNAPHTASDLTQTHWPHPYDRTTAVFPVAALRENKFWPAVKRLNDVYGDRNFCCACRDD